MSDVCGFDTVEGLCGRPVAALMTLLPRDMAPEDKQAGRWAPLCEQHLAQQTSVWYLAGIAQGAGGYTVVIDPAPAIAETERQRAERERLREAGQAAVSS